MARRRRAKKVFKGKRIGNQMPDGQYVKYVKENMKRLRPPAQLSGKISK